MKNPEEVIRSSSEKNIQVGKDLFFFPRKGQLLGFLPDFGVIASVKSNKNTELKTMLTESGGWLSRSDITTLFDSTPTLQKKQAEEQSGPDGENNDYLPLAATILLSHKCNLACRYCYSESEGTSVEQTPWPVLKTTVDFLIHNAQKTEEDAISITLHGGGEPFIEENYEKICKLVDYANSECQTHGLTCVLSAVTNGFYSEKFKLLILKHFNNLTVSYDGTADYQDANRPVRGGGASSSVVEQNIALLASAKFPFSVRCTVSADSAPHMTDIVQRLALDFRCNQVHFEPLYPIGRGLNVCGDVPSPETFAAGFVTASVEGEKKGVNVHFSGGSLRMRKINCGGCGENMVVLPTGQVTTCVEVSRPSDPYFKMFHVGICEPDKVVIDGETLQTLRERRVSKMESCASCFARNYCAGGCPIKAVKASGSLYDHGNNLQCQITRLVIEGALKHHINVHFSTTDERSAVL